MLDEVGDSVGLLPLVRTTSPFCSQPPHTIKHLVNYPHYSFITTVSRDNNSRECKQPIDLKQVKVQTNGLIFIKVSIVGGSSMYDLVTPYSIVKIEDQLSEANIYPVIELFPDTNF